MQNFKKSPREKPANKFFFGRLACYWPTISLKHGFIIVAFPVINLINNMAPVIIIY